MEGARVRTDRFAFTVGPEREMRRRGEKRECDTSVATIRGRSYQTWGTHYLE